MTDERANGGWLRRNVGAVVAWGLILLSSAFVIGVTSTTVTANAERVVELRSAVDVAKVERDKLRSDARVLEVRHVATEATVDKLAGVLDRLDRAVVRLEALASAVRVHP